MTLMFRVPVYGQYGWVVHLVSHFEICAINFLAKPCSMIFMSIWCSRIETNKFAWWLKIFFLIFPFFVHRVKCIEHVLVKNSLFEIATTTTTRHFIQNSVLPSWTILILMLKTRGRCYKENFPRKSRLRLF